MASKEDHLVPSRTRRNRGMSFSGMHQNDNGDDPNSSGAESDVGDSMHRGGGGTGNSGNSAGGDDTDDMDSKRKRRLELNRKAAKESRRRKKMRIEELGRSVVFLTRENQELREQNELLRQMVAAEVPPESNLALSKFQAENAALRLALYETVKQDISFKNKDGGRSGEHQLTQQQHHSHAQPQQVQRPKDSPSVGSEGTGGHGGGMSLADHPISGPLPSLAAAAAAVVGGGGNSAPGQVSSSSPNPASSLPLMSSLPPLPPPVGSGGMPGHLGGDSMHPQQGSIMVSSSMSGSLHHRHSPPERNNSGSGNNSNGAVDGNGRGSGESLLDVVGGAGPSGCGSNGSRLAPNVGMGGPFINMNVMGGNMAGGGNRDREGSPSLSGQVGARGGYGNGESSVGAAGGGGNRPGGTSILQHTNYGDQEGYGGPSTPLHSGAMRNCGKLDRGSMPSGGMVSGVNFNMTEMMARASSNAMVRARSMQQHGPVGSGGARDEDIMGGTGGVGGGPSGNRRGIGGWPPAWSSRDGLGGGGGPMPGSTERGL